MERDLDSILRRLEAAEGELRAMKRRGRRFRWAGALAVVAGGIGFACLPTATKVQAAGSITPQGLAQFRAPWMVVDARGKPIMAVGETPAGRGMLLFDRNGKLVCGIGTRGSGRGLSVFDADEHPIGALGGGSSADGVGTGRGLLVLDAAGKIVGTLGEGTNGKNSGRGLSVNDTSGTQVVGLGVWPQRPGQGQLVISDTSGNGLFAQPPLP